MTDRQVFPPLTLRATGLSCGRGGMTLTADLSFAVAPGQCLLLRGPNGTGKTTLLLTLAGIVTPLAGTFELEGTDSEAGPQLHYCGHRNAVKPRLSVRENLDFWAQVNGPTGLGIQEALAEVGLGELGGLDAGYLSAGQSRRLALARLLVTRLLDRHLDMGGLALAATHDPITLPDPGRMETLALGVRA